MATFRKRAVKWQVQVRRDGQPHLSRSFINLADGQRWARDLEALADRIGLKPDIRELRKMSLRALVERYRDSVVVNKRSCEAETALLNAFLRNPMADLNLAELGPAHFSKYRDDRLAKVKPASVRREFGIFGHMFKTARREWGICVENPLADIKKPPDSLPRERRIKDAGEQKRLEQSAQLCRSSVVWGVAQFAVETGMRRSEILRLRWNDIDVDKRTLVIPITKNGHPRTIGLSPRAITILAEQTVSSDRVFPTTANAIKLAWRRLRTRAGSPDLRLHDLRHEAVSQFFEIGLSVPEAAMMSGHRDLRQLHRYTHLRPEQVADRLASLKA